jgi:hypothetical protein
MHATRKNQGGQTRIGKWDDRNDRALAISDCDCVLVVSKPIEGRAEDTTERDVEAIPCREDCWDSRLHMHACMQMHGMAWHGTRGYISFISP